MAVDEQAAAESARGLIDQSGQGGMVGLPEPVDPVGRLVEGEAAAIDSLAARDHPRDRAEPGTDAGRGAVDEIRQRPVEHAGIQLPGLTVGIAVDAREGRGQQGHAERRGIGEQFLHEPVLGAAQRHGVESALGKEGGRVVRGMASLHPPA